MHGTTKDPTHPNNLDKEEESWKHYALWFQTILQSYSNQKSVALAHGRKPRSKPRTRNGKGMKGGILFNKQC